MKRQINQFITVFLQSIFFSKKKGPAKRKWVREAEEVGNVIPFHIERNGRKISCLEIIPNGKKDSKKFVILPHPLGRRGKFYFTKERKRIKTYLDLALLFHNLKRFDRSSYIARVYFHPTLTQVSNSGQSPLSLSRRQKIWTFAYPKAFEQYVIPFSEDLDVPNYLVWSIMRQESNFRTPALSKAEAHGLMQIIPKTAAAIAGKKLTSEELFSVQNNIIWGTQYLKILMNQFDQRIHLVASSYNAGPERTEKWLEKRTDLYPDEFIEEIPFRETRNYVKRVLRILENYSALYNTDSDLPRIFTAYSKKS